MTLTFDEAAFVSEVESSIKTVQMPVEHGMAKEFEVCVAANFGFLGFERPNDWKPLSQGYALKIGRTYATLEVTGAMKSQLRTEANAVKLSSDKVDYALDHESGIQYKNLPRRSVFPMQGGICMPRTMNEVLQAGENEMNHQLS